MLESDPEPALRRSPLVVGVAFDRDDHLHKILQISSIKLESNQRRLVFLLGTLVGKVLDGEPLRFREVGDMLHCLLVGTGVALAVHEDLLSLLLGEAVEVALQGFWPVLVVLEVFDTCPDQFSAVTATLEICPHRLYVVLEI